MTADCAANMVHSNATAATSADAGFAHCGFACPGVRQWFLNRMLRGLAYVFLPREPVPEARAELEASLSTQGKARKGRKGRSGPSGLALGLHSREPELGLGPVDMLSPMEGGGLRGPGLAGPQRPKRSRSGGRSGCWSGSARGPQRIDASTPTFRFLRLCVFL